MTDIEYQKKANNRYHTTGIYKCPSSSCSYVCGDSFKNNISKTKINEDYRFKIKFYRYESRIELIKIIKFLISKLFDANLTYGTYKENKFLYLTKKELIKDFSIGAQSEYKIKTFLFRFIRLFLQHPKFAYFTYNIFKNTNNNIYQSCFIAMNILADNGFLRYYAVGRHPISYDRVPVFANKEEFYDAILRSTYQSIVFKDLNSEASNVYKPKNHTKEVSKHIPKSRILEISNSICKLSNTEKELFGTIF